MNPYVSDVSPLEGHQLLITFVNGEQRIFDATPYIQSGALMPLKRAAFFRLARVVAGSVEWPGDLGLSYDTLYVDSVPVVSDEEARQVAGRSRISRRAA
jgi:hypothetical protein